MWDPFFIFVILDFGEEDVLKKEKIHYFGIMNFDNNLARHE